MGNLCSNDWAGWVKPRAFFKSIRVICSSAFDCTEWQIPGLDKINRSDIKWDAWLIALWVLYAVWEWSERVLGQQRLMEKWSTLVSEVNEYFRWKFDGNSISISTLKFARDLIVECSLLFSPQNCDSNEIIDGTWTLCRLPWTKVLDWT